MGNRSILPDSLLSDKGIGSQVGGVDDHRRKKRIGDDEFSGLFCQINKWEDCVVGSVGAIK